MPSLEFNLQRLAATNAYIRDAEARIAHLHARTQREKDLGVDASSVEFVLQGMADLLQLFQDHRTIIEQRIEEIRSGGSIA